MKKISIIFVQIATLAALSYLLLGCAAPSLPKDTQINVSNVGASQASTGTGIQGGISLFKQIKSTPSVPAAVPPLADAGVTDLSQAAQDNAAGQAAFAKVQADLTAAGNTITTLTNKYNDLNDSWFGGKSRRAAVWLSIIAGSIAVGWILLQVYAGGALSGTFATIVGVIGHVLNLGVAAVGRVAGNAVKSVAEKITGTPSAASVAVITGTPKTSAPIAKTVATSS